jgi:hypothetical protein
MEKNNVINFLEFKEKFKKRAEVINLEERIFRIQISINRINKLMAEFPNHSEDDT